MLPWKTILKFDRHASTPVYLQLADRLISGIQQGLIKPNLRLPGSRELSGMLQVHRNTIIRAYQELEAQGWIHSIPYKGTFVHPQIPVQAGGAPHKAAPGNLFSAHTGFQIRTNPSLHAPYGIFRDKIGFHDGPDIRLAPVRELSRAYRSVLDRRFWLHNLSYVEGEGKPLLRTVLSEDMNLHRGMNTLPENIFITRGSQMALFMLSQILLEPNDIVVTGEVDYYYAYKSFTHAGARLVTVQVDQEGLDTDQIESLCRKHKIRAVYVTPHHHYPTTVTMSPVRRQHLMALAERYGMIILEDDYDHEFHYNSDPILPMASADRNGMVVYIGTLSKTIAPAFRMGYVAAPQNLIREMSKLRQIIDIQGDPLLEQTIAELFVQGEIRRHLKKAVKIYRARRDHMCQLLNNRLSDVISFRKPEGGLALWARFDHKVPLPALSDHLRQKGVVLSSGIVHDTLAGHKLNSTRIGFGWMNTEEAEYAVDMLYQTIHQRKGKSG